MVAECDNYSYDDSRRNQAELNIPKGEENDREGSPFAYLTMPYKGLVVHHQGDKLIASVHNCDYTPGSKDWNPKFSKGGAVFDPGTIKFKREILLMDKNFIDPNKRRVMADGDFLNGLAPRLAELCMAIGETDPMSKNYPLLLIDDLRGSQEDPILFVRMGNDFIKGTCKNGLPINMIARTRLFILHTNSGRVDVRKDGMGYQLEDERNWVAFAQFPPRISVQTDIAVKEAVPVN